MPDRIPLTTEYRLTRLESRVDNMESVLKDNSKTIHKIDREMATEEAVKKALEAKGKSIVNWLGISIQGGMLAVAVIALHIWG